MAFGCSKPQKEKERKKTERNKALEAIRHRRGRHFFSVCIQDVLPNVHTLISKAVKIVFDSAKIMSIACSVIQFKPVTTCQIKFVN